MITTLSQAPDSIVLEPGQSLRTAVDAGAWLQVTEGRARVVSPPGWFGDTVLTAQAILDKGDVHRLAHGGWIEVSALTPVHLRVHAPTAAASARATPAARAAVPVQTWMMRLMRQLMSR